MKFIDVFWEKRNLGVNTLEIEFDDNEEIDYFTLELKLKKYDYVVAKVPVGNIKICHLLEQNGFKFMESQIFIKKKLRDYSKENDYFNKFSEKISIKQIIDKSSLEKLLSLIDEDMFNTDRISLDQHFGKKKAMLRYKNWIRDEFNDNRSELYELVYQDDKVGFFLIKDNQKDEMDGLLGGIYTKFKGWGMGDNQKDEMDGLLGGIYTKFKGWGMGLSIIQKQIEIAIERNKKYWKGKISSNNIPVIKLYNLYGFEIYDIKYVFRKINREAVD